MALTVDRLGNVKRFLPVSCLIAIALSLAEAGSERYSSKESVAPPCPSWYANNEWNLSLWGTYAFTANDYPTFENSILSTGVIFLGPGLDPNSRSYDRYLEADHAWGGGIDAKYFFKRYFGIGIEGFAVEASRSTATVTPLPSPVGSLFRFDPRKEERTIGSLMGTFTFRYPMGCSRFAPYVWVGGGAIFGGGEVEKVLIIDPIAGARASRFKTGSETKAIGQFGGGVEVRLTPHIGWTNDFSWNVIDGRSNNFGMARTGINFAF
jgi:hypothetical protein